jgi:hypothetical protein
VGDRRARLWMLGVFVVVAAGVLAALEIAYLAYLMLS